METFLGFKFFATKIRVFGLPVGTQRSTTRYRPPTFAILTFLICGAPYCVMTIIPLAAEKVNIEIHA
jgi:hypothetical protein